MKFVKHSRSQQTENSFICSISIRFLYKGLCSKSTISAMLSMTELVLGLQLMSKCDFETTNIWRCFNSTSTITPIKSRCTKIHVNELNLSKRTALILRSLPFDFSK